MGAVRKEALGLTVGADSGELDLLRWHAGFYEGLSIRRPQVQARVLITIAREGPRTIRKGVHHVISNGVAAGSNSGTNPRQ